MRTLACIALVLTLMASCKRDERNPQPVSVKASLLKEVPRMSELVPGGSAAPPAMPSPVEGNAYAISEGQNLFDWFNCSGCHGGYGGGGMGPPLNDDAWIYGSKPEQIFDSIVRGRPNGMPTWGGKIPQDKVWQLVAYVRSLSNLEPKTATPPRADSIERDPSNLKPTKPRRPQ